MIVNEVILNCENIADDMLMINMEMALQGNLVHAVKAEICRLALCIVLCQNTKTGRLLEGPLELVG